MKKISENRFVIALIVLALLYGVIFSCLKYLQYKSFFSFEWDDEASVIQTAYNISHGVGIKQSIFIAPGFYGRFTPFSIVMAIPYLFFPFVPVYFIVLSFSYGFSGLLIYFISRKVDLSECIAFVLALSFLVYAPLHYLNLGVLDNKSFSVIFLLAVFYFSQLKRFGLYSLFIFLAMLTKQDVALVVLLIGFYLFLKGYPRKWWLFTMMVSLIYFVTANYIMNTVWYTPRVDSHVENLVFAKYDYNTIQGLFNFIINRPLEFLRLFFSANHLRAAFLTLYPVLFTPLASLELFICLPMIMELGVIKGIQSYNSEYLAAIIPFVFIGVIYSLAKVYSKKRNLAYCLATLILAACIISNFPRTIIGDLPNETPIDKKHFVDKSFYGVSSIFDRRIYKIDSEDILAWKFINMIPKGASVTASGDLLTALSIRSKLYSFGLNEPEAWESEYGQKDYYPAYSSDYILIHTKNICNGLGGQYAFVDKNLADRIIKEKLVGKYEIIKEEGNFILLRRNGCS